MEISDNKLCLTALALGIERQNTDALQLNPVNTDTKGTCHSVRIIRALRENVRNTCFIDIKTKADSFTKYHVFTFLRAFLIVLGNTWIY